jgi:acyl carrier protein
MTDRVATLFSNILRIPAETVNNETSPDNTPKWDSLSAIDLVLAIEDEFDVKLTTKEIAAMRSIALVKKVLKSKGVNDV